MSLVPGKKSWRRQYWRMPTEERFMRRVSPEPTSGCWLWTGPVDTRGYGNFDPQDGLHRTEKAHRTAWRLFRGPIPAGLEMCHKCDNPACVNPDHLFPGTHSENMLDMGRKRRHWLQRNPEIVPRGEDTKAVKLTAAQVHEIRLLRASGIGPRALAVRFGVHRTNIQQIVRRQTWSHVA